VAADFLEH